MITEIPTNSDSEKIWKLEFRFFGSNVYLLRLKDKNILIDTSSYENKEELISDLESMNIKPSDIDIVLLTHNHWDHVQNLDLFINSNSLIEIYGSKKDFSGENFSFVKEIKQSETDFPGLKIIETPGHTPGSVCIYLKEAEALFSGDTIFYKGIGRTDFPESSPKEMESSLEKLRQIPYRKLCPGHNV